MNLVRTPLSRQVANEIRARISAGMYQPGDRLPSISQLASDFTVSVPSMRESLRTLELVGLLRIEQGKGVFVTDDLSLTDDSLSTMVAIDRLKIKSVYEARLVLEVGAVPYIVERATAKEIDRLRHWVIVTETSQEPQEVAGADVNFHCGLVEAGDNPLLSEVTRKVMNAVVSDIRFCLNLGNIQPPPDASHRRVLESLEARDSLACQDALRRHLMAGLARHEATLRGPTVRTE